MKVFSPLLTGKLTYFHCTAHKGVGQTKMEGGEDIQRAKVLSAKRRFKVRRISKVAGVIKKDRS